MSIYIFFHWEANVLGGKCPETGSEYSLFAYVRLALFSIYITTASAATTTTTTTTTTATTSIYSTDKCPNMRNGSFHN